MAFFDFIKSLFTVRIKKGYVSDIDRFLAEFDRKYPQKSASQLAEIKKFQRIYRLRDNPVPESESNKLWDQF